MNGRLWAFMARAVGVGVAACVAGLPGSVAAAQAAIVPAAADLSWWRVLGALAFCLVLAVCAAFALQARQGLSLGFASPFVQRSPRRLQVIATVRISPQTHVCLLECDGATLLVGAGPNGCTVLRDDLKPKAEGS